MKNTSAQATLAYLARIDTFMIFETHALEKYIQDIILGFYVLF